MTKYIMKKVLLAVFILLCITVVLFYFLGTHPLFDTDILADATGAYTTDGIDGTPRYIFSGDELEILLNWAKTIIPTERIGQLLLPAEPTLAVTNGNHRFEICLYDPHNKYDLVVYYNNSIYGALCEDSAFMQVIEILRSE
ncbi:MAG: hypothetical protein IKV63_06630 [Clostridia bacterium]|nr:hypothetical protein [Clostridia bacterium]